RRLGHQLRHEAPHIGGELAVANGFPPHDGIILDPCHLVFVDEQLQVDAQFLAVVQYILVTAGDARGAGVEVHVRLVVKFAVLGIADLIDQGARTHGEYPTTCTMGGFQNRTVIAGLAQFISDGQPCDAGAENNRLAILPTHGFQHRHCGAGARRDHAQRPRDSQYGSCAAGGSQQMEELTTRNWFCHFISPLYRSCGAWNTEIALTDNHRRISISSASENHGGLSPRHSGKSSQKYSENLPIVSHLTNT